MKLKSFFCLTLFLYSVTVFSQTNFNYNHYLLIDKNLNHLDSKVHTSIKPFFIDHKEFILSDVNSIESGIFKKNTWRGRFVNGNFFDYKAINYRFIINPIFNFQIGREGDKKRYVNTRGFELFGNIGPKISFNSSMYETQSVLPNHIENYLLTHEYSVPGQGQSKWYNPDETSMLDYAMSSGYVNYRADDYINIQFGHGKHFIGDGYRSMLLSDNSFNYPYLKITTDVWKFNYVNLYSVYQDLRPEYQLSDVNRKKYSSIHYLSTNLTSRLNIGLFEAIIWEQNTTGRNFDVNYFNPIIFYRPIEFSLGSRGGNAMLGFNVKYKLNNTAHLYSQFIIDEFKYEEVKANRGWWANKHAGQIGFKWFDAFKVQNLTLQSELNYARPFMYSHNLELQSYSHYNQSMTHPLGASFIEKLAIIDYRIKRWNLNLKLIQSTSGGNVDTNNINYGHDILVSYSTGDRMEYNNEIAQGNTTDIQIVDIKLAYLINPITNMKFELGAVFRNESSIFANEIQSDFYYFSFKTDLRNLYYDF